MTGDADQDGTEQNRHPSWTPWSAAYAYAEVMRDMAILKFDPARERIGYFDVPTMLIAYALADYAQQEGIVVTRPADLASLSGMRLWERLATDQLLESLATLSPERHAVIPADGEPMHDEFVRMKAEIDRVRTGARPTARAAEQRRADKRAGRRAWYERGEDGQAFVAHMLLTCVPKVDRDAGNTALRVISDRAEGAAAGPAPTVYEPEFEPRPFDEYMAADQPWPAPNTQQWAVRVLQGELAGRNLLAHYLSSVTEGNLDVPDSLVAPRQAGESADEHAQREALAKQIVEVKVALADYAPDVADEFTHIRPSDARSAVDVITREAMGWWTAAQYEATIDDILPAMTALLDGLVVPERRDDVQQSLNIFTAGGDVPLYRARHRLIGSAEHRPFETLHLAAAFATALFQVPACVPDPNAEMLRLATIGLRLAEGKIDTAGTASQSSSQPASARHADNRKKKARKASQKARRHGRR